MLSFLQPIELVEKNKMATCLIDIITDPVLCKLRFPMCRPSRSLHLRSTAPNTPFTQGSLKNSNAYTLCQGCRTLQLHRTKVPTRADRVVRPYGWCGGCGVPRRHALRVVRWMRRAESPRPTVRCIQVLRPQAMMRHRPQYLRKNQKKNLRHKPEVPK